jgi:hypothetical protein
MKHLVALLFGVFLHAAALAGDLEFKGLVMEAEVSTEQVESSLKVPCEQFWKTCDESWQRIHDQTAVKCGNGHKGAKVCNGQTSIAGARADVNVVIGPDGRLQRILLTVSANSYEIVLSELAKKYGPASSVRSYRVQNGFGASFAQVDSAWQGANGQKLRVSRYASTLDKSTVHFSTRADEAWMSGRASISSDL